MSIYDDDGFDEEAAELSEAITGSYTPAGQPGGQAQGFTFDDGGDNGVNYTLGKSDPRGGTQIQGNVIRGGKIFGRTQSQLNRQQRLAGMGDYRNSQQYKDYLTATGRSLKNPYGNTGLFSGIFGADKVNYNLDPTQSQNLLDIGFDRYMNFDQQTPEAQRRGFGKLFGGPEGEMTVEGELRAQVPEMTTAESLFRSVIPGASFLPNPDTTYVPMGTVDFQPNPGYDPERDPRANQDLRSGPFSLLTDALSKGRDFIASKLSPAEELAAQTRTQARGPELSQTVSGGRFEDESARPQVMTPDQEFLTFDGSIQNSVRQSQELSPQLDTISGGGRPKVNFSTAQPTLKETMSNLRRGQQEGRIPTQSPLGSFTSAAPGEYNPLARGDFLGDPTYPGGTNYGKRTDPEKRTDPLMVDFLNSIDLNKIGDLVNTVRSGPPSVQTPFGQLSLEPEFDGLKPVGAMLRLKGTF